MSVFSVVRAWAPVGAAAIAFGWSAFHGLRARFPDRPEPVDSLPADRAVAALLAMPSTADVGWTGPEARLQSAVALRVVRQAQPVLDACSAAIWGSLDPSDRMFAPADGSSGDADDSRDLGATARNLALAMDEALSLAGFPGRAPDYGTIDATGDPGLPVTARALAGLVGARRLVPATAARIVRPCLAAEDALDRVIESERGLARSLPPKVATLALRRQMPERMDREALYAAAIDMLARSGSDAP